MSEERGTLKETEPHPSAYDAKKWISENMTHSQLCMALESFSSCAIEGNRLGEICSETLSRLMTGATVSDRYLLGLAWSLRSLKENIEKQ